MGTRAKRIKPQQPFIVGESVKGRAQLPDSSYRSPKVHIEDIIERQRQSYYPLTDEEVMELAQRMPQ